MRAHFHFVCECCFCRAHLARKIHHRRPPGVGVRGVGKEKLVSTSKIRIGSRLGAVLTAAAISLTGLVGSAFAAEHPQSGEPDSDPVEGEGAEDARFSGTPDQGEPSQEIMPLYVAPGWVNGDASPPRSGWGYEYIEDINGMTHHWLGAFNPTGNALEWCINLDSPAPVGSGTLVTEFSPNPAPNLPSHLHVTNEEMGWILKTYANSGADNGIKAQYRAAMAFLVHANYEEGSGRNYVGALIDDIVNSDGQHIKDIYTMAGQIVGHAREANAVGVVPGDVETANHQNFMLTDIAVKDGSGKFVSGKKFEITLNGPAVFDEGQVGITLSNGGKTASGKTGASGVSISGRSTGNGEVTTLRKFWVTPPYTVSKQVRGVTQDTLSYREYPAADDPVTSDGPSFDLVYDFQPEAVSDVGDWAVVAPGTATLQDSLDVSTVTPQPEWLGVGATWPTQDGYAPLPVQFKGIAYYAGITPPAASGQIPDNAVAVAEADFIAEGPGTYDITADLDLDAVSNAGGFITWVWEVDKDDQPQIASEDSYMLRGSWTDGFGTDHEITSLQWEGKIESNLKVHPTNDNTYLVDDVWVSGLPADHPNFDGGRGFESDTGAITQSLYFWADQFGEDIVSLDDAELIGAVDIPAKNGFHPSVGDLEFKLVRDSDGDLVVGTYQFVHDFAGDDRVAPFVSQIPDEHEQYVVTGEPQIGTTAAGSVEDLVGAFENVTITDEVCYLNLVPGKEYELQGTLMDQKTGKPLMVDGREVTASKKFAAENAEGCETLEFTFDASALAGTTTVVFEDLYQDGVVVATHSEIEDEGQTVYIPELGTTATTPDGGKLVEQIKDATIVDKACYSNLRPGREYKIVGKLMDKPTGKPLVVAGEEVTASKTFTAEKAEGCVELEFVFDSSALSDREVVVFEDLYRSDVKIAAHADINDAGQTVRVEKTPESGEELAKTGANGITLGLIAAGVGGLGSLLLYAARRRGV